jgi:hypothetical protein
MTRLISRSTLLVFFLSLDFALSLHGQNAQKERRKPNLPGIFSPGSFQVKYVRFAGQSAPSKEFHVFLDHQAKWDENGVGDQNGSYLRFVPIENPAAQGEHGPARYRVFAEGAPQNKVYSLQTWLVNDVTATDPRDLYVNGQGLVMVHRPRPEEESIFAAGADELEVESRSSVAEPIRFLLSSLDADLLIYGTLVGHPLLANDQGCRLEVRIAQPNEATVLVVANGFPGKSKIPLVLRSGDWVASDTAETNSDGHAVWAVSPIVPGVAQGTLKASAEGPNCLPSVLLPWRAAPDATPKTADH